MLPHLVLKIYNSSKFLNALKCDLVIELMELKEILGITCIFDFLLCNMTEYWITLVILTLDRIYQLKLHQRTWNSRGWYGWVDLQWCWGWGGRTLPGRPCIEYWGCSPAPAWSNGTIWTLETGGVGSDHSCWN